MWLSGTACITEPATSSESLEGPDMNAAHVVLRALASLHGVAKEHFKEPLIIPVLEPTTGPWQNNPNWGAKFQGALPAVEAAVLPIASLDNMPGPPRVQTIQLFRSDPIVSSQNADVHARITYGLGAVNNTFDVDWLQGVQLSLLCNTIRVDAITYAPNSQVAYASNGDNVVLAAGFGEGSPSRTRVTFGTPSQALVSTDSALFPVPDFAKEVIVNVSGNNDPAVPLGASLIFNGGGVDLLTYDLQVAAGGRALTIPTGTKNIQIPNTTLGTLIIQVTWVLSL